MRIIDLALKDLSQMLRDKRSLLFVVAMPILFTLFMGMAYRGSVTNSSTADTRIPLAVVLPETEDRLSQMLLARLDESTAVKAVQLDETQAMDAFHKKDVAGVLVVPSGFSQKAEAGALTQLQLIADANSSNGQSLYQLLRSRYPN